MTHAHPAEKDLEEELLRLKGENLFRQFRILEDSSGVQAEIDGKRCLLFCGNDYLGLSRHPRVVAALKSTADSAGVGAGAARLISGTTSWHVCLEEKLAGLKRKEGAVLFSAGYLANLGALTAMAGPEDLIVMDKLCHASLVDGARLAQAALRVFPHRNYDRCRDILRTETGYRRVVLVSETVFSMDGDLADLQALADLKREFGCWLVVDDAHGTGILGREGRGGTEGYEHHIDLILGTLSKALGCLGGFVAASRVLQDYVVNKARTFIFATALPPALCAAAMEAIRVAEEDPSLRLRLWQNAQRLHEALARLGCAPERLLSPILPVILGNEGVAMEASRRLLDLGFLIPAVRTPTVAKGKARLRITVSAAHTADEIDRLVEALEQVCARSRLVG